MVCQKRLRKEFMNKCSLFNAKKKKNLQRIQKMTKMSQLQVSRMRILTEKKVRNLSIFILNQAKKILKSNRRKSQKFLIPALSNIRLFQRNLSSSISFLLIFQKALTKSNSFQALVKFRATIN